MFARRDADFLYQLLKLGDMLLNGILSILIGMHRFQACRQENLKDVRSNISLN